MGWCDGGPSLTRVGSGLPPSVANHSVAALISVVGPGAGGAFPTTDLHDRFPYNAIDGSPINELIYTKNSLNTYLPTCGGWQRDATYRFTAQDWQKPQFVYLFAHNDKTSANNAIGQISSVIATLIHYVETEDTLDNMRREDNLTTAAYEGYVQRNKHGGVYTSGNRERYPFGVRSQGTTGSRISGFTTYGFTDYRWLYGYVKADQTRTGLFKPGPPCQSPHMGVTIPSYQWFYGLLDERESQQLPQGLAEHGYVNPVTSRICMDEANRDSVCGRRRPPPLLS